MTWFSADVSCKDTRCYVACSLPGAKNSTPTPTPERANQNAFQTRIAEIWGTGVTLCMACLTLEVGVQVSATVCSRLPGDV
eukprot:1360124-Amphidinium_carterae.1